MPLFRSLDTLCARARTASIVALTLLLCSALAARAQAQVADETAPKAALVEPQWLALSPPPEQTVDGVRVRLRAICWCRANQLVLPADGYLSQDDEFGLAVRYEVRGETKVGGKPGTLTKAAISGSSGAVNSATTPQVIIAPQGSGGVLFWSGANPRWPRADLRLEWRGGDQTENAEGKFSAPVEFELPVPTQTDVPVKVEGKWRSVHGTQYFARQVMVATKPFRTAAATFDWEPGFYFSMQHKFPPNVSGIPDIDEDKPEFVAVAADGSETFLQSEYNRGWVINDIFSSEKRGLFDEGFRSNYTGPLPPATKSVKVRFVAREASDDWRDESALQRFRFPLDLSRVPLPPVDATWKPFAVARGQRLEVALDNWRDVSDGSSGPAYTARFSTRDTAHPDDARRLWLLRGSKFSLWSYNDPVSAKIVEHDELKANAGFEGVDNFTGRSALQWRPDGTPVIGSRQERDVTFKFAEKNPDGKLPDGPLAIEGTWDEWLAIEHDWNLEGLPIPQPGQIITVNRELKGDGARLILRSLSAFDATHAAPGMSREDAKFLERFNRSEGLVASFEVLQTTIKGARLDSGVSEEKQGTQQLELRDNKGRKLSDFIHHTGDYPRWTATFELPGKDAKSLSLHLTLTESAPTGASETLTVRDLPRPAPAPSGKF